MNHLFIYLFSALLMLISANHLTAQSDPEDPQEPDPLVGICYLYDDAGNRTVRYVCGGPHPRPAPGDLPVESDAILSSQQIGDVHEIHVRVYPNPANDYLQVVQQGLESDAKVLVYSPDGREVLTQILGDGQIAIGHLPAATYFLVIQGNGAKFTASFVRQGG